MVWRHRRGVIAARPFVHIHSPFTAIYHDYCTCGIFFFSSSLCSVYLLFVHPCIFAFPHPHPPSPRAFFFCFSDLPICIVIVRVLV